MQFELPWVLAGLAILPLLLLYHLWYRRGRLRLRFTYMPSQQNKGSMSWLPLLVPALYAAGLAVLIVAAARPVTYEERPLPNKGGLDVVVMLDISKSMEATDYKPNRLEVAKIAIADFVASRPKDRIGIGLFAEMPISLVPVTQDHKFLVNQLIDQVHIGLISPEGTALGDAMGMGINRLSEVQGADKVLLLVTDGGVNTGALDPQATARVAAKKGIRVFTLNLTTPGDKEENYDYLCRLAGGTGGTCYQATDKAGMQIALRQLDKLLERKQRANMEQIPVPQHTYWVVAALILLAVAALLQWLGLANPLED